MGSKEVVTMAKEPETESETSDSNEALTLVYMSRLAKRVREARRNTKLKQSELGAIIGSNQSYIHIIEASRGNVTLKNLVHLGQALGIKPEDLLKPDETLPVIDAIRIQQLSSLVQESIQEVHCIMSNIEKINNILQQVCELLTEDAENLKKASAPES